MDLAQTVMKSMALKIHIYTAALNEEKFVDGWVAACKGADGLHVIDTGCKDDTVEKLRAHGVKVVSVKFSPWKTIEEYDKLIAAGERPWRFDTARQMNLDMIPHDADVCLQVDMDEKPVPNWREIIEANWKPGMTQMCYLYGWRMDGERPVIAINYNKCHARHGYHWIKPIHEVVCAKPGTFENVNTIHQLLVRHYPETKDRTQYLHMLELSVREYPEDPVDRFYYARELYFYKRYDDAIRVSQEFLALPRSIWGLQRCMACIYIADSYATKLDKINQEKWLLRACAEEHRQREGWFSLAEFYRKEGRNLDGYIAAKRALAITNNPQSYLQILDAWGAAPHDCASVTGWYAGFQKEALAHAWDALRQDPFSERLINNYTIMLELGSKDIAPIKTEPIDVVVLSWSRDEAAYKMTRNCLSALKRSSPSADLNIVVMETNSNLPNEPWYKSNGFEVQCIMPGVKFNYNLFLQKAYAHLRSSQARYLLILNNDLAAFSINFIPEILGVAEHYQSVSPLGLREALWGQFDTRLPLHVGYDLSRLNGWAVLLDKKIFNAAPFEAFFPAELEFHNQDVYYAKMLEHFGFRHALTTKAQALHLQARSLSALPEDEKKRLTIGQQGVLDSLVSRNIHKSAVYDCFTFFNELDTLEIRLETLDSVVDKFVLVESTKTFSGIDKPLVYRDNQSRFEKFAHKIIHVVVDDMPDSENRWDREHFQRNAILRGLTGCKPTNFIMISDVDEIPNPDHVCARSFGAYKQDMYNYYYNVRNTVEDWVGTVAAPYSVVLEKSPQALRDARHDTPRVMNGGWHFSWIGDANTAAEKLKSFSHHEYDNPETHAALPERIKNLVDFAGRSDRKFERVAVDAGFPMPLRIPGRYSDKMLP